GSPGQEVRIVTGAYAFDSSSAGCSARLARLHEDPPVGTPRPPRRPDVSSASPPSLQDDREAPYAERSSGRVSAAARWLGSFEHAPPEPRDRTPRRAQRPEPKP